MVSRSGRKIKVPKWRYDGATETREKMISVPEQIENSPLKLFQKMESPKNEHKDKSFDRTNTGEESFPTEDCNEPPEKDSELKIVTRENQSCSQPVGMACHNVINNQLTCHICSSVFTWKKSLRRHYRQKHKKLVSSDGDISDVIDGIPNVGRESCQSRAIVEDGGKPLNEQGTTSKTGSLQENKLICDICQASFTWKKSLVKHFQMKHGVKDDYNSFVKNLQSKTVNANADNCSSAIHTVDNASSFEIDETNAGKNTDQDQDGLEIMENDLTVSSQPCLEAVSLQETLSNEDDSLKIQPDFEEIISGKLYNNNFETKKSQKHQHCESLGDELIVEEFIKETNDQNSSHDETIDGECQQPVKCEMCDLTFRWRKSLMRHKRLKHNDEYMTAKAFKCRYCEQLYPSFMERFYHEKDVHDYVPAAEVNTDSKNKKTFKCPICYRFKKTENGVKNHIQEHYKIDIKELTCDICNLVVRTKGKLKWHKEKHIKDDFNKNSKEAEIPGLCDICGRSFKTRRLALQHRTIHLGNAYMKYVCPVCKKAFRLKSNLNEHLYIHRESKDFVCEICGVLFRARTNLRRHRKSKHGIKEFKCKFCHHKFQSNDERKSHYLQYHGGNTDKRRMKVYSCPQCDHVAVSSQTLTLHLTKHSDNKAIACPTCGRCYTTVSQLDRHKKSHRKQDKSVRCKICDQRFVSKHKMKIHLSSNKHKENCRTVGFDSDSVITDVNNTDIVEILKSKNEELEDWAININKSESNTVHVLDTGIDTGEVAYEVQIDGQELLLNPTLDKHNTNQILVYNLPGLREDQIIISTDNGYVIDSVDQTNEVVEALLQL